jgi:signal transduction histidine kinase
LYGKESRRCWRAFAKSYLQQEKVLAILDAPPDVMERWFRGDSEQAVRMRAFDWAMSELGSPTTWPDTLRVAVSICLASRFPIVILWGPKWTLLYNDAYIPFLGNVKHPRALGRSVHEVWPEIDATISPMLANVRRTGKACWVEDILFYFDRAVSKEEAYFTFSYTPVFGDGNKVEGIFCPCMEATEKVIGARRLETLRRLGIPSGEMQTIHTACRQVAEVLAENPQDIPFVAIYVVDDACAQATLCASVGLADPIALPGSVSLSDAGSTPWPLAAVLRSQREEEIDLSVFGLQLSGGVWSASTTRALILPIPGAMHGGLTGLLVVGVSPHRPLDEQYRSFFELIAGHIGPAIMDARAYEAERRRVEALAELDRAKTAFFDNISHEFRTPLTLMLAPLQDSLATLSESSRTAVGPLLEMVHRNALRLLRLVNSLLEFSCIEAGRVDARFQPTDLASLTADLAGVFRSAIERAGLKYIVRCEQLPEPVFVDREMWEKIVLNLLSNAYKFSFEGEIELMLGLAGKGIELRVRDTGIGVAPDALPRIFERFHRIEGVKSRTVEGSGIGLALVRELVHIHGGDIRVESEPGKGATFMVSLPLGSAHLRRDQITPPISPMPMDAGVSAFAAEALRWLPNGGDFAMPTVAGKEPAAGASDELSGARILIVDDNADLREYLMGLLASRWTVETASDGAAAFAAMRKQRFDLVLTDAMMPELDGFGLLKKLRADPTLECIPVIILSARAGEESRVEGLQSGADDYLIKPFSAREVVARVEAHLKLAARRKLNSELEKAVSSRTADLTDALEKVRKEVTERERAEQALRESEGRLRKVSAHLESVREEQSAKIAREVHDELGGLLTVLKLGLSSLMGKVKHSSAEQERVITLVALTDSAIKSVKRISTCLRPAMLDTLGLIPTIKWHLNEFSELTGIDHELRLPEYIRLSAERSTGVFRILQEALTNVARHAEATKVGVRMKKHKGQLVLEVEDDGKGITDDALADAKSFGILGMHERSQFLGGELLICRAKSAGTVVRLRLPLNCAE